MDGAVRFRCEYEQKVQFDYHRESRTWTHLDSNLVWIVPVLQARSRPDTGIRLKDWSQCNVPIANASKPMLAHRKPRAIFVVLIVTGGRNQGRRKTWHNLGEFVEFWVLGRMLFVLRAWRGSTALQLIYSPDKIGAE